MDICKAMNFAPSKRAHELTDEDVAKIRDFIQDNYKIEGDLRREISMAIKRLTDLGTFRGIRHKKVCPCVDKERRVMLVPAKVRVKSR